MINNRDILCKYYKDFLQTDIITESELNELAMLFQVIYNEIGSDLAPQANELLCLMPNIKSVINLVNEDNDTHLAYLDMLRTRELKGDQRTIQWKQERYKYITASVSAACAGLMGPASRENQLLEKASMGRFSSFKGGYYTDIGNIFEPVTNSYYSMINNTRIHDYGLIPHDKEPWTFLAASTDGVSSRGTELTNIEIKTLPGRVPDGKIKKPYFHQMQHQMECLGLSHSDFIEVKYMEWDDLDAIEASVVHSSGDDVVAAGIIAELYENGWEYEYSPMGATFTELRKWQTQRNEIIKGYHDRIFVRWIYWTQTHYSCIRVEKDPTWLQSIGPALQKFYDEMIALRNDQKKVNQMINEREQKKHNKRNAGNELFQDCML